jgi:hypothetical protein
MNTDKEKKTEEKQGGKMTGERSDQARDSFVFSYLCESM